MGRAFTQVKCWGQLSVSWLHNSLHALAIMDRHSRHTHCLHHHHHHLSHHHHLRSHFGSSKSGIITPVFPCLGGVLSVTSLEWKHFIVLSTGLCSVLFRLDRAKFGLVWVLLALRGRAVVMLVASSLPAPAAGGEVLWSPWRAETDLQYSVLSGVAATLDAMPSVFSGFAHPGRSPPCLRFPLFAATLESVLKNVGVIVLALVSVVFSVNIHCHGSGKAKEGKCQKLKPSFEDYGLCEVRFAASAPQVWLLERLLGSSIVCFFSAVAQVAAAAAAYLEGQELFCVFFIFCLIIVSMSEMLLVLLGVPASWISVFVVIAGAAATNLARAAAHKFVLSLSSGEVVWCSILAKVQDGCWASVLHGHVLGLRGLVMRLLTLVNMQVVLVGDISSVLLAFWLSFVGLVATTPCHERKGSRFAFGKGNTTGGRGRDPQRFDGARKA